MTELPDGIQRRTFDGKQRLATQGPPVYGEPTDGGWRCWDAGRSKLGAMIESGLDLSLAGGESVLYLGAASGTTVSHVADFAGPTYAVEFAPRPLRELLDVAETRENLFPLLKDARQPESYSHIVESELDLLIQDVATRGQAAVACNNAQFLSSDGQALIAIKARSEDVTAEPAAVFETVCKELTDRYEIVDRGRLKPFHDDHLGVVARKR